jgi:hypothetical protein
MAETPRVYPGRPLIAMSVSGYEQGAWKDAALNWIEETEENAVEVIANAVAIGSPHEPVAFPNNPPPLLLSRSSFRLGQVSG